MGNVIVSIHQPNFMPWLGYFYKIWQSNIFIFLDDVQIQKTGASYTNRVNIIINNKENFLTVPIKRDRGTCNINQTKLIEDRWRKKIIGSLQSSYGKTPFFLEYKEFIFELINYKTDNIADYNINFILEISKKLNFTTEFFKSSGFNIETNSTQRLIDLVQKNKGTIYLSGKGGNKYQDIELYKKNNISVIYNEMPIFEYSQINSKEFINGLSIVDAIFNIGIEELKNFFIRDRI